MIRCSGVLLTLVLSVATFAVQGNTTQQTLQLEHIQKKVQLVEYVLADIKHRAGTLFSTNTMFDDGYQYAVNELAKAKVALANKQHVAANEALNQAFVNMSYARSFLQKAKPSIEQQAKDSQKLQADVAEYLAALESWLAHSQDQQASEQLEQAKVWLSTAKKMAQQEDFASAKVQLNLAYSGLVTELARVRDKEITIVSLNFDSPKDEYHYEQKRLESYKMLLKLRQKSTKLSTSTNTLIATYIAKSRDNEHLANTAATQQDFRHAITALEAANENYKRALRITGLNML